MRDFIPFPVRSRGTRVLLALLALSALLAGIPEAHAKLGATVRQCIRLYGTPTGDTDVPGLIPNGVMFQRGDYSITCGFERDRCTVVVILRNPPGSPELQPIPRDDVSLFMQENFGTQSWTFTRLSARESFWKTHDWRTRATYTASFAPSLQMLTLKME